MQNGQGDDCHADPEHDLTEVVGVAGAGPQTGLDELAFVFRVCVEAAFLSVSDDLDRKSKDPYQEADQGKNIQPFAVCGCYRDQRCGHGECHPQGLDGPDVQETDKGRFDFIEAIILSCFLDAAEQESAQADCPDHDQRPEQDRPGIEPVLKSGRC